MLYREKYERARRVQQEQNQINHPKEYDGEKLYTPTPKDEMEKGDMFALIFSAIITILPIAIITLLVLVVLAMLFFRLL